MTKDSEPNSSYWYTITEFVLHFSIPVPGKILITPGGNPAFTESSANLRAVNGDTCAGFMTTVLPAARQAAIFHDSIIRG
jgi:hypothetical protein